jgi:hypothetical protein
MVALHLLQRIYGTMIVAAPDPAAARAVVDRAQSTLGLEDTCAFCSIMLDVPAAIACAAVGDLEHARHHLRNARRAGKLWQGTTWEASVLEARAHVARAEGDVDEFERLLLDAAERFELGGQPADAARCRTTLTMARSA